MLELDTKSLELDINFEQCSLSLVVRLNTIPEYIESLECDMIKFIIQST